MEQTTASETTTSAPSSFSEAAAALEASSASTPATTTPAETPAPAATTQAAAETPVAGSEGAASASAQKATGEPPQWRWQDILETQRKKAAEEARAAALQEYQWATGISPEDRAILSQAIAAYKQPKPASQSAADAAPEPDLQAQDGTLVYSAPQLQKWHEWNEKRLLRQFEEQLKPLKERDELLQEQERALRSWNDVTQITTKFRAAHPDFHAHEPTIAKAIFDDPELADLADRSPALALEIAYNRVAGPATEASVRARLAAELQQKTAASTINPAAAHLTLPRRPKDFHEAAQMLAEQGR